MQQTLDLLDPTIEGLYTALGNGAPETLWLLIDDADEASGPVPDDFDEILELRCASL